MVNAKTRERRKSTPKPPGAMVKVQHIGSQIAAGSRRLAAERRACSRYGSGRVASNNVRAYEDTIRRTEKAGASDRSTDFTAWGQSSSQESVSVYQYQRVTRPSMRAVAEPIISGHRPMEN